METLKEWLVKIAKAIGYIIVAILMLWVAKEVLFTSVDKSQQGDSVEYIENRIP